MKTVTINIFIITFLILSSEVCAQNYQSGKIIYREKQIKNPVDTAELEGSSQVKKMILNDVKKIKQTLPYLSYNLTFNKTESRFEAPDNMINDNGMNLDRAISMSNADGVFYTDIKENQSLRQYNAFNQNWLVKQNADRFNWSIKDETKKIQGYICKKATTEVHLNRDIKGMVTAWFCPELPFQFGPLGFSGLPGLILGLERHGYYFYAHKITISEKDRVIKKPQKGKPVTRQEYIEETNKLNPYIHTD